MKKILCILLAVMLVASVAVVSAGAYNTDGDFTKLSPEGYKPSDSYTVDKNTPYSEDAVKECGGSLDDTQTIYFHAPEDWANEFNTFEGPDDSEPYMHACAYWWSGTGSKWPDGSEVKWVGYQAHLVDKENRIYAIKMPNSGSPMVIMNNGVNAGMDKTAPFFKYGRQIMDTNVEGAYPGDYDTLPEGSIHEEDFDGCILTVDYSVSTKNPLTGFDNYGYKWYIYYGDGHYGCVAQTSENFKGIAEECQNPEHHHAKRGDPNNDQEIDVLDAEAIQLYLVRDTKKLGVFDKLAADVDLDGYVSIVDATRIQRYAAGLCDLDGNKAS